MYVCMCHARCKPSLQAGRGSRASAILVHHLGEPVCAHARGEFIPSGRMRKVAREAEAISTAETIISVVVAAVGRHHCEFQAEDVSISGQRGSQVLKDARGGRIDEVAIGGRGDSRQGGCVVAFETHIFELRAIRLREDVPRWPLDGPAERLASRRIGELNEAIELRVLHRLGGAELLPYPRPHAATRACAQQCWPANRESSTALGMRSNTEKDEVACQDGRVRWFISTPTSHALSVRTSRPPSLWVSGREGRAAQVRWTRDKPLAHAQTLRALMWAAQTRAR